ncbi:calcium activated cation channel [Mycena maculata]|uniref:Calcium activated cation channel n=1 Tax=Mycena maculata TaxID=230809 RepID=A0AAD7N9S0_9AGAR|nr:calcium activated cation channel [Mycena maculata]
MDQERTPLVSLDEVKPSPATLTKLVKRLRALTLNLLPVEVDPEAINDPTSRVITPQVIKAYRAAAGDFVDALPYCLLRARAEFLWDANHNPADYGENLGRAAACEMLARRIVHIAPPETLNAIMSTRFQVIQLDGDKSDMSSALEMAIDSNCSIFLSSSEAQDVVNALWRGDIIQENNKHNDIDYVQYSDTRANDEFFTRLNPSRMSVPRYQSMFRIVLWFFFLFVYSQAVRQPLERSQGPPELDEWEIILYTMALSFLCEDINRLYKLLKFVTYKAFNFWMIVAFLTDGILTAAFVLRIVGMRDTNDDEGTNFRLTSFQILSFAAPLMWIKIVTIFDGYKYVGTMQICVARMLQESGIFFALLSVLSIGFAQGLYALDASDGTAESSSGIVHVLVQALLQSPDYSKFSGSTAGLILYYLWGVITCLILLNILISLFSSAYSDVVDDAAAQYLAFFASKTVGMIRAPDSFVYPAPFNLIEVFLISPLEFTMSAPAYAKLNRFVMAVIFFIPLAIIAFYESVLDSDKHKWMKRWLSGDDEGACDRPEYRDPEVDEGNGLGRVVSKVPFDELVKAFPNTGQSSEALMLKEILELKKQLAKVLEKLDGKDGNSADKADS